MIELTHDLLAVVAARGRDFRDERKRAREAIEARERALLEISAARKRTRNALAVALIAVALLLGNIFIPLIYARIVRDRTRKEEQKKQARSAALFAQQAFEADRQSEGLAYLASSLKLDPENVTVR